MSDRYAIYLRIEGTAENKELAKNGLLSTILNLTYIRRENVEVVAAFQIPKKEIKKETPSDCTAICIYKELRKIQPDNKNCRICGLGGHPLE